MLISLKLAQTNTFTAQTEMDNFPEILYGVGGSSFTQGSAGNFFAHTGSLLQSFVALYTHLTSSTPKENASHVCLDNEGLTLQSSFKMTLEPNSPPEDKKVQIHRSLRFSPTQFVRRPSNLFSKASRSGFQGDRYQ